MDAPKEREVLEKWHENDTVRRRGGSGLEAPEDPEEREKWCTQSTVRRRGGSRLVERKDPEDLEKWHTHSTVRRRGGSRLVAPARVWWHLRIWKMWKSGTTQHGQEERWLGFGGT